MPTGEGLEKSGCEVKESSLNGQTWRVKGFPSLDQGTQSIDEADQKKEPGTMTGLSAFI